MKYQNAVQPRLGWPMWADGWARARFTTAAPTLPSTMSSVGVKRKLPPPPGSPDYIAARGRGRVRGDGGRNTTAAGRGGRGRGGRGRGSSGRGQAGRGGGGAGAARVRGERTMDRQLGQDAPPPESLHKYVRGPGNATEVSGYAYRLSLDSSCACNA